ncbi:hypothetical protein W02_16920 [Nitrospira sp. KM1]|uniref:hypothetical protein n=1 Tax=Nitrospira sp. KM1 TaxID=1936990 RepID=UPI0013A72FA8|nr:hypothetical protein [Nitrospira sp. KM1]BCA54552.1 hypothetical protein W02_16920 [Nitrospira sp. KM1]
MTMLPQFPRKHPQDEWLGGESHVPNLNRELRSRARRDWEPVFPWLAGSLFIAGMAVGAMAGLWFCRSRRGR